MTPEIEAIFKDEPKDLADLQSKLSRFLDCVGCSTAVDFKKVLEMLMKAAHELGHTKGVQDVVDLIEKDNTNVQSK